MKYKWGRKRLDIRTVSKEGIENNKNNLKAP